MAGLGMDAALSIGGRCFRSARRPMSTVRSDRSVGRSVTTSAALMAITGARPRRRRTAVMRSRSALPPRPAAASILVVDDDALMVRLVRQTLEVEGYTVWTATRAADARKLLEELAGAVDLVLTDVAMPGASARS